MFEAFSKLIGLIVLLIAGLILIHIYSVFAWGLTLQYFWTWFIIPVWEVKSLSFVQAAGIIMFMSIFKSSSNSYKISDVIKPQYLVDNIKSLNKTATFVTIILPWVTLGIGNVFYRFILN